MRKVVAAKSALDSASNAYRDAAHAYRLAESLFIKEAGDSRPSDVYYDPYYIDVLDNWQQNNGEPRLEFTKAERCQTSE